MDSPTDGAILSCVRSELDQWLTRYNVRVEPDAKFVIREPYSDVENRVTVPLRGLDQIYGPMFTDIAALSEEGCDYSLNVDSTRSVIFVVVQNLQARHNRARSPSPVRRSGARSAGSSGRLCLAISGALLITRLACLMVDILRRPKFWTSLLNDHLPQEL